MKTQIQDLILDVLHAEAEACQSHQRLAAACQQAQEAIAAEIQRHLGHARRWFINSRSWQMRNLDLWVSSNIEFSQPTLSFTVTLRPTDDEPLLYIRLQASVPLRSIRLDRPLPIDLDLPPTLPMTYAVRLHPHYRATSWKTYPELTL